MANTSPATCQCLATFTPLKSKILIFFRDVISLLARVVILLIDTATQEVPMKKYLKEIVSPVFDTSAWIRLSTVSIIYTVECVHLRYAIFTNHFITHCILPKIALFFQFKRPCYINHT